MDKLLIDKYKEEMMGMYRTSRSIPAQREVTNVPNADEANMDTPPVSPPQSESTGNLIVTVTTVRSLYPVENAEVTVFGGSLQNRQEIDRDFTDESGRTKPFVLETPAKSISLNSQSTELPYELYGIEIKAEGYIDTIYLNVPVFSGTTSIQRVNMMLLETEGKDKGPMIFDTAQQYMLSPDAEQR